MSRELLILRHGKSDREVDGNDFNRPLKARGVRGVQRIGSWLQEKGLIPDFVISSPARRALDSAVFCCNAMDLGHERVEMDSRIYQASRAELCEVLLACPDEPRRVLLVGHNPGLEDLMAYLLPGRLKPAKDGKRLPTSTLVRLKMPNKWHSNLQGCARLLESVRASDLTRGFPVADGELREKPSYYYTQSGAIPYRIKKGQLKVLLVSSTHKKRWLFPKGVLEPGHTQQEMAAIEAYEEASVEGVVDPSEIGRYRRQKWGAECCVTLYPLRVEKELAASQRHEPDRKRRWATVEEALSLLDRDDLKVLLRRLVKRLEKSGTKFKR